MKFLVVSAILTYSKSDVALVWATVSCINSSTICEMPGLRITFDGFDGILTRRGFDWLWHDDREVITVDVRTTSNTDQIMAIYLEKYTQRIRDNCDEYCRRLSSRAPRRETKINMLLKRYYPVRDLIRKLPMPIAEEIEWYYINCDSILFFNSI